MERLIAHVIGSRILEGNHLKQAPLKLLQAFSRTAPQMNIKSNTPKNAINFK